MGRFGNLLLIAGEPHLDLSAKRGEVVRLYFTNTANTRVFNVALPAARMKLIGGDSGRVEHDQFVDSVILAPSERVIVDVMFAESVIVGGGNSAGQAALHMAEHASAVTVVVRGQRLGRGMSNYLVERIDQHPRITVRTSSQVVEARGDSAKRHPTHRRA